MTIRRDIRDFKLDPAIFSPSLYKQVLQNFLASYPTPRSIPTTEDLNRWFGFNASPEEKALFDLKCRKICMPALSSIGPALLDLPNFESHAEDRKLYSTFAAPFVGEFQSKNRTDDTLNQGDAALAVVLLLDEMPRNCFRGDAQGVVYSHYDRLARAVAYAACEAGFDVLPRWKDAISWRNWFYMPLIHSEDLMDHKTLAEKNQAQLELARERHDAEGIKFIERMMADKSHTDPLEKFGRYPWRNKFLGRESTPAEKDFLEHGGGPHPGQ